MSNKRQISRAMTFVKLKRKPEAKRCDVVVLVLVAILAAILPTTLVACAKLETQIKLLINDDELLLQPAKHAVPAARQPEQHEQEEQEQQSADHEHYNLYRSELKRLSYESIHRILRDENEPLYRREDAEMHYYQQRSYQPRHEVVRRSAQPAPQPQYLSLAQRNLTEVSFDQYAEATKHIQQLNLSGNSLQALELRELPQLRAADLSQNALTALPLDGNSTLVQLNLNGNRIKQGVAPLNFQLRELHLSANEVETLATLNLSQLHALETLDLSCNRIEGLETSFFPQRMHNLRHLNLAHNRLGSIYRETFYNLLSLNTLLLRGNNISDIDYETFLALPNLQYLDLSHNQLKGESIRALQGIPDLMGLSIAYNGKVGASMQEFVASWSLKELDASGTGLCQIPAALAQSVRSLKLTDNWLKIINCGDLDSYPLLQYLDLSHSRIEDIEDDALGRLEILEVLFLDHNSLRKVPTSLPTSLEHLFLQHNQIMDIQVQAFQGLNNLQTLDLSGNQLLYLPALALPKLLTLNLQASGLKGLSQAIVHTLPRLRDLLLEDNPIKCSDLLGIAEWASPCRVAERGEGGGSSNNRDGEQIANLDAGQQQTQQQQQQLMAAAKIDLKQRFLQMHNFFEKFQSGCGRARQMEAAAEAQETPTCADEAEGTEGAAAEQQQQAPEVAKLPLQSLTQRNFNQKNITAETAKSLPTAAGKRDETEQQAAAAAAKAAMAIMPREIVQHSSSSKGSRITLQTAKVLRQVAATKATTTTTARRQQITEGAATLLATGTAATQMAAATNSATAAAAATKNISNNNNNNKNETAAGITVANQDAAATKQATRNIAVAATAATQTTTTTATFTTTTAAIKSVKGSAEFKTLRRASQKLTTTTSTNNNNNTNNNNSKGTAATTTTTFKLPSASSLNNNARIAKTASDVATTPTTTTTTIGSVATTAKRAEGVAAAGQTTEGLAIHVLPEAISTAIKSSGNNNNNKDSNNNYVGTTAALNRKVHKTAATAAATHERPTTTNMPAITMETTTTTTTTWQPTAATNWPAAAAAIKTATAIEATTNAKIPAAIPAATTTTAATSTTSKTDKDLAQKDNGSSHGNKLQANGRAGSAATAAATYSQNVKPTHSAFDGTSVSGHKNMAVEPTSERVILAKAQQSQAAALPNDIPTTAAAAPTTTTTMQPPQHKHEPLQLHVRDRHLIGTPLLMHKGQNLLVAAERLLLPTTAMTKAQPTTAAASANEPHGKAQAADSLARRQQQQMAGPADKPASSATAAHIDTTTTTKPVLEHHTIKDVSANWPTTAPTAGKQPKRHEAKRKPSLTMKKMTVTKHAAPQPQHYTLNAPRENEAIVGRQLEARHFKELKPAAAPLNEPSAAGKLPTTPHKHSTVNTPIVGGGGQHSLNIFAQQQHEALVAAKLEPHMQRATSKSEQWLDLRKAAATGHPGVVILLSLALFVVLLVGLMHVYRCDMPWRRHLPQPRPHQRHFNEDDAHSFLHYQSSDGGNPSAAAAMQQWHHSTRRQPPYSSPLHNLHARELQQSAAAEQSGLSRCKQLYRASDSSSAGSQASQCSSRSSSSSNSHASAAAHSEQAFYIEAAAAAAQPPDSLHSDLLPMELLNVSAGSRRPEAAALAVSPSTASAAVALALFDDERNGAAEARKSAAKSAPSARKFGLW